MLKISEAQLRDFANRCYLTSISEVDKVIEDFINEIEVMNGTKIKTTFTDIGGNKYEIVGKQISPNFMVTKTGMGYTMTHIKTGNLVVGQYDNMKFKDCQRCAELIDTDEFNWNFTNTEDLNKEQKDSISRAGIILRGGKWNA